MIALHPEISAERNRELHRRADSHRRSGKGRARRGHSPAERSARVEQLSIRRLGTGSRDRQALEQLAGRDSAAVPTGDVLGAELDGRLVAAISLTGGERVADPFTPTSDARALLALRATQMLEAGGQGHGSAVRRRPGQVRRHRPLT
jgi:hypothetical protein